MRGTVRQAARAKRRQAGEWTGTQIPEAYRPIEGRLRESLRTAIRDPGTYTDLRWMVAYYGYGAFGILALPLWPLGLIVDGVWCGLLRRIERDLRDGAQARLVALSMRSCGTWYAASIRRSCPTGG